ncbi:hypothetical protein Mgra_00005778 [Meloidogyne graminicola]|uniref:Uncharacterized protein n=1 Tax=Meloidogyne graminicola TaxID=189291 RepID=A0A8S9ZP79_9BILA|nr:hypothetical protein Mgra_00005778 [Meloidogyne graminicola]
MLIFIYLNILLFICSLINKSKSENKIEGDTFKIQNELENIQNNNRTKRVGWGGRGDMGGDGAGGCSAPVCGAGCYNNGYDCYCLCKPKVRKRPRKPYVPIRRYYGHRNHRWSIRWWWRKRWW